MTRVDGGELLAHTLQRAGVKDVFALQGGHLDAFLVACDGHGIRLTDTRHEAAAGHAADGYARSSAGLGVCAVTAGPGFANAFPAIVNAHLDAVPVLFLVGAAPLREDETNPLQGGIDQVAMATPTTKWAYRITHTERIPELIELAIRKATTGKPGPVLIEIPIDILFGSVDEGAVRRADNFYVDLAPAPGTDAVSQALDILRASERPVIMIGGGARFSGCQDELRAFAEQTNVPVVCNSKAFGLMPPDHPLHGGTFNVLAAAPMVGLPPPDTVLMLGARFGLFTAGRSEAIVPESATIIQVNVEAADIGRIRNVRLPIVADVRETLIALTSALGDETLPDWGEWATGIGNLKHGMDMLYGDWNEEDGKPVHPYHAVKAIAEACPEDTLFIGDGGESHLWIQHVARVNIPGGLITHGYLGCLGIGPGMAMGVQRAYPDNPVVLVTGDGSAGFHIQEFETMVRHGLPVITVILNNQAWGMSWHGQRAMFGHNRTVITKLEDSNYEEVCVAFGGNGERASTVAEIKDAMARALASGVPTCINVSIDPEVVEPSMGIMLGGGEDSEAPETDETSETVMPYYENLKE
ncbi:MAG: thiamine pyrophosphate-binding protein [Pseudomonadales bacterium]|jgi:acetolactate synthase-1/2/3 large subunit|nr:thiamine pyrophosphate-binding protein [Pseudomonadales bacterium]MDP6472318.1 thiamine pyrophosphate-binding protein [Pseudomonadales bacterium]MDP6828114.1 thiamine pyrophosphate-binding protein [Pseudomonadales bacterium]MDP6971812.1 thiamine pyrophosphate-binding protein [Pseudomonadales bacterium]